MSYDTWKSTDTTGDTSDTRALPTAECLAGFHTLCKDALCVCECHGEQEALLQLYPCKLCHAERPPMREDYMCVSCGKTEEANPFPSIGCWCLVRGWVCETCRREYLDKVRQHG